MSVLNDRDPLNDSDPLAPARGALLGVLLGVVMWIAIGFGLWRLPVVAVPWLAAGVVLLVWWLVGGLLTDFEQHSLEKESSDE